MAELNELTINGSNYTFEDDVARGLATTETNRAQEAEHSLQTAINNKVDKVTGKGLSTNDYTNGEKAKLAGLNNYDDTQVRQLIAQTNANFANYYTKAESYSAAEVDTLLRTQRQGQFVVVNTLPMPSADTMFKIYLVPSTNPETQNVKDEFVTLESNGTYSWEQIGTTVVDLSGYSTTAEMNAAIASALASYYTKSEVDEALGGKQNTIDDLANIRSGAQAGSTAVQPSVLNNVVKNTVAESCVYDVSANNDNTKFESLSALLSSANLNTLIPTDIRKGGMSIKFVQSSDNKYVQARCMAQNFTTDVTQWQGVDDEPTAGSDNLVKSGGVSKFITTNHFIGKGTTYTRMKFKLMKERTYRLVLDDPSYARDNTGTDSTQNIFVISYFSGNTEATFFIITRANDTGTLNKYYDFTVPQNADYVAVGGRANKGVEVLFSVYDITEINNFEQNFSNISDLVYKNNAYFKSNGLSENDVNWYEGVLIPYSPSNTYTIECPSDLNYDSPQVIGGISSSNTIVDHKGYLNGRTLSRFTPNTVYMSFSVRKADAEKFKLYSNGALIFQGTDLSNNIPLIKEQVDNIKPCLLNNYFTGNGSTYVSSGPINLMRGRKYRLVFDNPDWARDATGTGNNYLFSVECKVAGTNKILISVNRGSTVNKSYDFAVPNDCDEESLSVGGRANANVKVIFDIYDITESSERTLTGLGSTVVADGFNKTGSFVLRFDDNDWARNNTGSSGFVFAIGYKDTNNGSHYINPISSRTAPIEKEYTFSIPDDAIDSWIQIRANNNVAVKFELVRVASNNTILSRNKDKLPLLFASSNKNNRLQILIATDSHEGWGALQNAVDFTNQCANIQALFVMGDCTGQAVASLSVFERYNEIINTCTKPVFCIAGNHDCGYDKRLRYTALEDKICEYVTEPTYQHLAAGEYTAGKAYYYHDFTAQKIRAIFLYEYDETISLVPNVYWEAVAYDSTKNDYTIGTEYAVDDIVNFGLYTANSFKCIQAHTASADNEIKLQEYRGYRFIGQTQMAWLVATMLSTPTDYNIIICSHIPASSQYNNSIVRDSKFSSKFLNGGNEFNGMAGDYLGILANAFNAGASGTLRVSGIETFTYMNTQSEGGQSFAYEVAYNFSAKNSGTKFMCFLAGHTHVDFVFKNAYNQYCISPTFTTATTRQFNTNDVPRSPNQDDLAYDALTVVAFDTLNDGIVLTRVGTTATTDGYLRDVDRLDLTQ